MPYPFYRLSSFTKHFSKGNPAGLVILPKGGEDDDEFFSVIGVEMALPETAFVRDLGDGTHSIRWFSSVGKEEKLCGHATLAASGLLYAKDYVPKEKAISFKSKYHGILVASFVKLHDGTDGIQLDFPAKPAVRQLDLSTFSEPLLVALKINRDQVVSITEHEPDLVIEVESEDIIHNVKDVHFDFLGNFPQYRGFVLTARSDGRRHADTFVQFVSRAFFFGVHEDPVTGSAHCALCPYWSEKLDLHGKQLAGFQASSRGGVVFCEWDKEKHRVYLRGSVVLTIEGTLHA